MTSRPPNDDWFFRAVRTLGVVLFMASLPMDLLNGHGKGFLGDHDHFQTYEVLFGFPVLGITCVMSPAMWHLAFLGGSIGLSGLVVGVGPFIQWSKIPTAAAVAFVIATLVALWFFTTWNIQLGAMRGCFVWLTATACGLVWLLRGQTARWAGKESVADDPLESPTR